MQIGVCCCVSYSKTESWVATAYTIRYRSAKAALGPGVCTPVSRLKPLDDDIEPSAVADAGGGGGSMTEDGAGEGLDSGSGNDGIGSSADEVSIVMCFVTGGLCLSV